MQFTDTVETFNIMNTGTSDLHIWLHFTILRLCLLVGSFKIMYARTWLQMVT